MSMKNSINTIGNRTCDLQTCSVVPQPKQINNRCKIQHENAQRWWILYQYYVRVQIECHYHKDFSCQPWSLSGMNFTSGNFNALCDKHHFTGVLVKTQRNRCSLLQVKFHVAVDLFVRRPLHKPFPRPMEKNSGKRRPIPRLKRTEYDMLPKFVFVIIIFFIAFKHFIIKSEIHNSVRYDLLE